MVSMATSSSWRPASLVADSRMQPWVESREEKRISLKGVHGKAGGAERVNVKEKPEARAVLTSRSTSCDEQPDASVASCSLVCCSLTRELVVVAVRVRVRVCVGRGGGQGVCSIRPFWNPGSSLLEVLENLATQPSEEGAE